MYQPFIGRKEELDALEKLYETEGFQMMIVYGRRRIGKSTLLSHFIRGKKAIFYTAARNGLQRNLQLLSRRVLDVLAPDVNVLPPIEAGASCFNENSATDSKELRRLTLSPQA